MSLYETVAKPIPHGSSSAAGLACVLHGRVLVCDHDPPRACPALKRACLVPVGGARAPSGHGGARAVARA